ncbi:hypothetical protein PU630_17195 [Microbacterium horticulturae]|uniref:Uncharacterized protein n=1 Tax=Microbacterium horticulturae TaxID=3028316 RepID=A0ABY8BXP9_9MICO|nr:hypothetical protein [Microbacterium sp. KACC 23027]WEG08954.1 hypothetical protein PU630_17195 [Microbacterium sp. KACC 23027]
MTPAQAVTADSPAHAPAAPNWIGPDLVSGEGLVSVDVSFLVRDALAGRGGPAPTQPRG